VRDDTNGHTREQDMNRVSIAASAAALVIVIGTGIALSPAAHGQARTVQGPRVLDVFVGGSRIGVAIQDVETVDETRRAGATAGVFVEEVTPESPADQAGVRAGDLIVEFDGERVRSARQFTRLVQETPAGRSVALVVMREGRKTPLSVTPRAADRMRLEGLEDLGALVEDLRSRGTVMSPRPPVPPAPPPRPSSWSLELTGRPTLGITTGTLSPQLAEYFGAPEGVLVASVAEGSVAQKMGVRAGDVITAVNESSVRTPADLRRRLQTLNDGDRISLAVVRDRKAQTLEGKVEHTTPRRHARTVV
jgi:serine protease Do